MSYQRKKLAMLMGISYETVKKRILRGKALLREKIDAGYSKRIKEVWEIIVDERSDTIPREEELKDSLYFSKEFPEQRTRHLPEKFIYIRGKTFSKLVVCIVILIILASSVTVYAVVQMLERHINDINTDIRLSWENIENDRDRGQVFPCIHSPCSLILLKMDITDNTTIVEYTDGHHEICFRQELSTGAREF